MDKILKVVEVTPEFKTGAQKEAEVLEKHEANEQAKTETPPVEEPKIETPVEQKKEVELKDEELLSLVSKKLNKPLSSFDELVKEELPEDVAAFYKFKKETGKGVTDYAKLSRDYDAMSDEEKLFEYLSAKEEGLDKEDIQAMIAEYNIDEELDTESEITKKNIAKKKTLNEAKKFFKKQKEDYYKENVVSTGSSIDQSEKEEFEAYKQYMQSAKTIEDQNNQKKAYFEKKTTELFSPEFKGFEFSVKAGETDKSIVFAPMTPQELKAAQSTPLNLINKYMDENGLLKDPVGYHKALAVAMNYEKFAQHIFEQGYAAAVEDKDKTEKNINMSMRPATTPLQKAGIKVTPVDSSNFSGGLKIKSVTRL